LKHGQIGSIFVDAMSFYAWYQIQRLTLFKGQHQVGWVWTPAAVAKLIDDDRSFMTTRHGTAVAGQDPKKWNWFAVFTKSSGLFAGWAFTSEGSAFFMSRSGGDPAKKAYIRTKTGGFLV
jgi:hypothetical protein